MPRASSPVNRPGHGPVHRDPRPGIEGRARRALPLVVALLAAMSFALLAGCTDDDQAPGATPTGAAVTGTPSGDQATPTGTAGATGTPANGGGRPAVDYDYGLGPSGEPTPGATAAAAGGSAEQHVLQANIGAEAPEDLIAEWDIDITPSGDGLPDGQGDVQAGADVYAANCARCHGQEGFGTDLAPRLALGDEGEPGPWQYEAPRTVANYWPYLTTYMDYIRRSMPFDDPTALNDEDLYAVVAWILNQNGMLEDDAVLDRDAVMAMNELPNHDSFFRCYPDECRPEAELQGSGRQ